MANITSENLTDRQLKFSYWYITNKLRLRKYLIYFLIFLSLVLYCYIALQSFFYLSDLQVKDYQVRKMIFGESLFLDTIESLKPLSLQLSTIKSFDTSGGRYDYISQIKNENPDWLATFDYQFVSDEDNNPKKKGFVLPGQSKYLMDLGVEDASVSLEVSNQKWQKIRNYDQIYNDRYRFSFENEDFIPGKVAGDPNILAFDVVNNTAYSYWDFPIQAFLYDVGGVVSVNYITLEKFKAGETRRVELFWNTTLPRISGYDLFADINVLDETNIMPPEGDVYLR